MNWFNQVKLIKTSAAKDKIKRYDIANPSLRFFIHRYETSIPWNEVDKISKSGGSADDYIQEFISKNLLSSLQEKIDPQSPDSNFMKPDNIPDEDIIIELNQTAEAQGMRPKDTYPPETILKARQTLLDDINTEKKVQFNRWWEYMNEEDTYVKNPAFQYSILKPMVESSPPTKKNSSPPLNAEILAGLWEEVNNGVEQMNVLKKYRKLSVKAETEKVEKEGGETEEGGNWIRLKGGPSVDSPEELKENINRLKNLSQGTRWCTARGMADTYLPKGDFYLYLENEKAVVAIRCEGNRVAEIRGYDNKQQYLDPYWETVINFLSKTNLDYQDNPHYKSLQKIMLMNADIEEGDTGKIQSIVDMILKDPRQYGQVSEKNRQRIPQFREAAADGYRGELDVALSKMETQELDPNAYFNHFDRFQDLYNSIPAEVKDILGDMQPRIFQAHRRAFNNNPYLFNDFPADVQAQFSPEEQAQAWQGYIYEDPYHYNDPRIPTEIKRTISPQQLKEQFNKRLAQNAEHLDYIPPALLGLWQPGELENYALQDFINFPVDRDQKKLRRMEELEGQGKITHEQIVEGFRTSLRTNPQWADYIPVNYKNEVFGEGGIGENRAVLDEKKKHAIRDPNYFKSLAIEEQDALLQNFGKEIGQAFAGLAGRYRGILHEFWISVPENVRDHLPPEVIDQTAQYYANLVNANPSGFDAMFDKIPIDIQPYVLLKMGKTKKHIKIAKRHNNKGVIVMKTSSYYKNRRVEALSETIDDLGYIEELIDQNSEIAQQELLRLSVVSRDQRGLELPIKEAEYLFSDELKSLVKKMKIGFINERDQTEGYQDYKEYSELMNA